MNILETTTDTIILSPSDLIALLRLKYPTDLLIQSLPAVQTPDFKVVPKQDGSIQFTLTRSRQRPIAIGG